eukprot:Opistho-1_new@10071
MVTPYLAVAAARCFSARMVLARAIERRVSPSTALLLSCCVAFCIRRPKWAFCRDFTSASRPATSFWRSSAVFILCSPESLTQHARHERGAQRKFGGGQRERLTRQLFGHTDDLVEHLAGLDFSHVVLDRALAVAHADFGWLLGNRLVREHADPDAAATLDVTGDRTACGLDLAGRQTTAVGGLQAEVAERDGGATGGDAGIAAFLFFTELAASGLQHVYSPLPSAAADAGAASLRTRLTAGLVSVPTVASAGLSLPSAGAALAPGRRTAARAGGPAGRSRRGPRGRRSSSARGSAATGASLRPHVLCVDT